MRALLRQWDILLPVELQLLFVDDGTADGSIRRIYWVYGAILSAPIQLKSAVLIGQPFTMQVDIDPKHTAKTIQDPLKSLKREILQWPSQSPDL